MPTRFPIRITAVAIACGLVLALLAAWRADRRDRAQLAADLATGRQALAQADARQHDRDAQLLQTLAALAAEKRAITAPAQIVRTLPQQIPLPAPIRLTSPGCRGTGHPCPSAATGSDPDRPEPAPAPNILNPDANGVAVLPIADLKPLYDFSLVCAFGDGPAYSISANASKIPTAMLRRIILPPRC